MDMKEGFDFMKKKNRALKKTHDQLAALRYREAQLDLETGCDFALLYAQRGVDCSGLPEGARLSRVQDLAVLFQEIGIATASVCEEDSAGGAALGRWAGWITEGYFIISDRTSFDGVRVNLSDSGRDACVVGNLPGFDDDERDTLKHAWGLCPQACESFLCRLVARLNSYYSYGSAFRRQDVLASLMVAHPPTGNSCKAVEILQDAGLLAADPKADVSGIEARGALVRKARQRIRALGRQRIRALGKEGNFSPPT